MLRGTPNVNEALVDLGVDELISLELGGAPQVDLRRFSVRGNGDGDENIAAKVCLVGARVRLTLFGSESAFGVKQSACTVFYVEPRSNSCIPYNTSYILIV